AALRPQRRRTGWWPSSLRSSIRPAVCPLPWSRWRRFRRCVRAAVARLWQARGCDRRRRVRAIAGSRAPPYRAPDPNPRRWRGAARVVWRRSRDSRPGEWRGRRRPGARRRCTASIQRGIRGPLRLDDTGLLAAVLARSYIVLGAEHPSEVSRAVEAIVERDRRDGAAALSAGLQCARACFEAAAQDVACHGLILIREQMMQIAGGHLAGLGDARGRQIRIVQMRLDVI